MASKNDPDAVSLDDHLALAEKVEKLQAALDAKSGPTGTSVDPVHIQPAQPDNLAPLDPVKLGYEGSFTERKTGRKFARKVVAGHPKPHKLLTLDHGKPGTDGANLPEARGYHELTEEEFRNLFDKD